MDERNKKNDIVYQRKMEIDEEFNRRHQEIKNDFLNKRRNIMSFNAISLGGDKDIQMKNEIVDVNLIVGALNYLSMAQSEMKPDKASILKNLKIIRKELTKQEVTKEIIDTLIKTFPGIIVMLSVHLLDFKNSEIQFETIWILNNFSIYCYKYNMQMHFFTIGEILMQFFQMEKQFSNNGVKNLIYEKVFCLIGNLVFIDEKTLTFYLQNNILVYLFQNMNSSVSSLRCVCLCTLNKIYSSISKNQNLNNYISIYIDKNAISYYKFILTRVDGKNHLEEVYEFYTLINSIIKTHPEIASFLFFAADEKEITKRIKNILSISMVSYLIQPCVRLLSNLIVISNTQIIRDIVCNCIINDLALVSFINNTLNSSVYNEKTIPLLKDILLFVFNLSCMIPTQINNLYHEGIISLCKNDQYMQYIDITKLVLNIYYRMFVESGTNFNNSDIFIVNRILDSYKNYFSDINLLLISADVLFVYMKKVSKYQNEIIENGMRTIQNKNDVTVNDVYAILIELEKIIRLN